MKKVVLLTLLFGLSFTFLRSQSADCDITQGGLTIVNAANTANVSSVCIGQVANFKFSIYNGGSSTSCTIPANSVQAVFSFPGIRYSYNGPASFTTGYFTWTYSASDDALIGINTTAIPNGLGDADVLIPVIGTTTGAATSVLNITQNGGTSDNPNNNSSSAQLTVSAAPTATIAYTGTPYCNIQAGWVERSEDAFDGRKIHVSLTSRALVTMDQLMDNVLTAEQKELAMCGASALPGAAPGTRH